VSASLSVGQAEYVKRVFRQSDFDRFAVLSGDVNPIHVDPQFAARSKFGRTVAHGMFLYSVVCSVLGTRLPGPGTLQLEQDLIFPSPTYAGEQVTVHLEVTETRPADGLIDLTTVVIRPDGSVGLQGRTLARLPATDLAALRVVQTVAEPTIRPNGDSFKGLRIGLQAEAQRAFTAKDLAEYATWTGDTNPLFTDACYARQRGLDGPVVPGGLLGGMISCLLGTQLPGLGTNYLKQRFLFPNPAYTGQEITAKVTVVRIRPEKELVNLSTVCVDPAGRVVCHGEALVLVSDLEPKTSET
jgi:acyl dehydratase